MTIIWNYAADGELYTESVDWPVDPAHTDVELRALIAPIDTATERNLRRDAMGIGDQPQATLFDGKTLPDGASEDWWGGPASSDDPEGGGRTLNVPSRANNQTSGPFNTVTAKPGDMVTVWPAEGDEGTWGYKPAWGKVGGEGTGLRPDDAALRKDTQTEHLLEMAKKAAELEDRVPIGMTVRGPVYPTDHPMAKQPIAPQGQPTYDPSYQAPPAGGPGQQYQTPGQQAGQQQPQIDPNTGQPYTYRG